jgi:hypothetical protein
MNRRNGNTRSHARNPEIDALAYLDSESEMYRRLMEIAGAYGRVLDISSLPKMLQADEDGVTFLVDFEMTVSAVSASKDLRCPLIGFSTLVVWVPRHGRSSDVPYADIERAAKTSLAYR